MLQYKLSSKNPVSHYLEIEALLPVTKGKEISLFIPAWRPGRYERADYVKNIRSLQIEIGDSQAHLLTKAGYNSWKLKPVSDTIKLRYSYFAFQHDAGGSYIDDEFCLLNPINWLIYPEGEEESECTLELKLPDHWQIATTLGKSGNGYFSSSLNELTDKPILASADIKDYNYRCGESSFHLKVQGNAPVDLQEILPDFKKFTKAQTALFGSFPYDQYYFILLILPFRFYHGVEHDDNTVLVLGIDENTNPQKFIDDLLGVASHELFHVWNIKRIRPKEFRPYNFKATPTFDTGMIAEGFTTYYGDLFLARGGVWDTERFLQEVNIFLKRHFRNIGRKFTSLVTSSENLSVDGYNRGAPFHNVSIYIKGALVAIMLDFTIRIASRNRNSLDTLMLELDQNFINNGYSLTDIKYLAEKLSGQNLDEFFTTYFHGINPLNVELERLSDHFGLKLIRMPSDNLLERYYGISTSLNEDGFKVEFVDDQSPAFQKVSIGDQIIAINGNKPESISNDIFESQPSIKVDITRLGRKLSVTLERSAEKYLSHFSLQQNTEMSNRQKEALAHWLWKGQ